MCIVYLIIWKLIKMKCVLCEKKKLISIINIYRWIFKKLILKNMNIKKKMKFIGGLNLNLLFFKYFDNNFFDIKICSF